MYVDIDKFTHPISFQHITYPAVRVLPQQRGKRRVLAGWVDGKVRGNKFIDRWQGQTWLLRHTLQLLRERKRERERERKRERERERKREREREREKERERERERKREKERRASMIVLKETPFLNITI